MGDHSGILEEEWDHACLQVQEGVESEDLLGTCWAFLALTEPARLMVASRGEIELNSAPQRTRLPQGQEHHLEGILTIDLWEGRLIGHKMGGWHTLVGFFGGAWAP